MHFSLLQLTTSDVLDATGSNAASCETLAFWQYVICYHSLAQCYKSFSMTCFLSLHLLQVKRQRELLHLVVGPTILPTGGAGHVGDGAASVDNHGK